MIGRDILTIFRKFKRDIIVSLINILGLTVAFVFVIFALRYIYSEKTFDRFHQNRNKIFRIERADNVCFSPNILHSWLLENIPDIKKATRILNDGGIGQDRYCSFNNTNFRVSKPLIVDSTFFSIFTFPLSAGETGSFSNEKNSIVLTQSLSNKLFADTDPVGKTLLYKNEPFTVKAVLKEIPPNSSIQFDLLIPSANLPDYADDAHWTNNTLQIFIQTTGNIERYELQQKIQNNLLSVFKSIDREQELKNRQFVLNPLGEIYYSGYTWDNICTHGNRNLTLLISSLTLLVLLIALINFINASVARVSDSVKTISIRAVTGASRQTNIRLIVLEFFLPFMLSIITALVICLDIEPLLNPVLSNTLVKFDAFQIMILLSGGIFIGILAGLYPAFYLTSFRISEAIKGKNLKWKGRYYFRNLLSVVQFTASISLIIVLITINRQTKFIFRESASNFQKEKVLYVPLSNRGNIKNQEIIAIQKALKDIPEVEKVSTCLHLPGDEFYSNWGIVLNNKGVESDIMVNHNCVDVDFPEVLGYQFVNGRSFNPFIKSDEGCYIVNEAFIKKYNISDLSGAILNGHQILGVIKDFHFNSLRKIIEPLAIQYIDHYQSRIILSLNPSAEKSPDIALYKIRKTIDGINPHEVADIQFLDDHIASLYYQDNNIFSIILYLSFVSLVISCMGLFAMSLYSARSRTKEIGIRKVNGARIQDIMIMFNKDFIKWVLFAFIISIPVALYGAKKWLQGFAYKTELNCWIFFLGGFIALCIALFTVTWQSWFAAARNPVEALRYE